MGELERRNYLGTSTRQLQLDKAAGETIGEMYSHMNRVFRDRTGEVVRETKAIKDDQHFQYAAGFADEATKDFARHLLQTYNDASADVRAIANRYRGAV